MFLDYVYKKFIKREPNIWSRTKDDQLNNCSLSFNWCQHIWQKTIEWSLFNRTRIISTQAKVSTCWADRWPIQRSSPPSCQCRPHHNLSRTEGLLCWKVWTMGLENDAELKKLEEELQRERERVARLEREVNEKMRQQAQKNSGARRQGRWPWLLPYISKWASVPVQKLQINLLSNVMLIFIREHTDLDTPGQKLKLPVLLQLLTTGRLDSLTCSIFVSRFSVQTVQTVWDSDPSNCAQANFGLCCGNWAFYGHPGPILSLPQLFWLVPAYSLGSFQTPFCSTLFKLFWTRVQSRVNFNSTGRFGTTDLPNCF